MEKVSINSDLELELLLLTDSGKEKITEEKPLEANDYIDPNTKYVKVRVIQNRDGKEFVAINSPIEDKKENCYVGSIIMNDVELPTLIVVIPSKTFTEDGFLYIAIETKEYSDKFEDDYKNTESILEKIEIRYVSQ